MFKYTKLIVRGNSMHPTYEDSEVVEVRLRERGERYQAGDVVVISDTGRLLLKRVFNVRGPYLDLAGDNVLWSSTHTVGLNDVIGLVNKSAEQRGNKDVHKKIYD